MYTEKAVNVLAPRFCLFQPELLGERRGLKEEGIGGGTARVTSRHIYSKPFH